jgi:hypothetical protein
MYRASVGKLYFTQANGYSMSRFGNHIINFTLHGGTMESQEKKEVSSYTIHVNFEHDNLGLPG